MLTALLTLTLHAMTPPVPVPVPTVHPGQSWWASRGHKRRG